MQNKLLIDNEWRDAASGQTMDVVNPATEEIVTAVACAGREDLDAAVSAARAALAGPWSAMSARERGRLVRKLGERLIERADEVARLETVHNGKPISESRHIEIPAAAECFEYYGGWSDKVMGETIPVKGNHLTYTLREPIGVVAAIVPVELSTAAGGVEGGAGAGLRQYGDPEAGEPDSADRTRTWRNRARGGAAARRAQRSHRPWRQPRTGDCGASRHRQDCIHRRHRRPGKGIMRGAADTLKRITLELGGKSPNIVLADADIEAAVRGATIGIFYGKGEVCAAGSRLLVDRAIKDEFIDKLAARAKKIVPGDPLDPKTRFGAVSSRKQMETVLRYIDSGKQEGATFVAGGLRTDIGTGKGFFVQPTVFADVQPSMTISREEIFGPVLAAIEFADVDEAIARANDSPYGLAAGVWTRDIKKAHYVARKLQAGTVWINTYNVYDTAAPFGGYKQSGFGREMSAHALEHYTQVKTVWVDLNP